MEKQTMDELLTIEDLAALLKVPKSWIYSRTRTGEIPHIKLGKGRLLRFQKQLVCEAMGIKMESP